jgi:hypothetical protein
VELFTEWEMASQSAFGVNWIPRAPSLKLSGSRRSCRLRRVSQLMREGTNDWDCKTN